MKNKVLIKLIVPELNQIYDLFIPVNEYMWRINKLLIKAVSDLSDGVLDINNNYVLVNKVTGNIYHNDDIIIKTDIRNGSELVLFSLNTSSK